MPDRRTCSECGRVLTFLMATDESIDPFGWIAEHPWLQVAVAWLILLAAVGLEAILR